MYRNIQSRTRSVGGTVYPMFIGVLRREVSLMSLDMACLPYSQWDTFCKIFGLLQVRTCVKPGEQDLMR